jgi:hypothetical protein
MKLLQFKAVWLDKKKEFSGAGTELVAIEGQRSLVMISWKRFQ